MEFNFVLCMFKDSKIIKKIYINKCKDKQKEKLNRYYLE